VQFFVNKVPSARFSSETGFQDAPDAKKGAEVHDGLGCPGAPTAAQGAPGSTSGSQEFANVIGGEEVLDRNSVRFVGRHDHGELEVPREGTQFDGIAEMLVQAKDATNKFLGPIAERERLERLHREEEARSTKKRSKTADTGKIQVEERDLSSASASSSVN